MRGRFMKFPASYGYDVGDILANGRQVRHSLSPGVSVSLSSRQARGKDMEPRKAAMANVQLTRTKTDTGR